MEDTARFSGQYSKARFLTACCFRWRRFSFVIPVCLQLAGQGRVVEESKAGRDAPVTPAVIPAKAGIQENRAGVLDWRLFLPG